MRIYIPVLDASAKIPSGIMTGNVNDLGDYFQCLGIDEFVNNMEIQGKYCAITVPLNQEDAINIPDRPSLPDITLPPFISSTAPDVSPEEVEEDDDTIRVAKQYEAIRRYAYGISGLGEPVESRQVNRVYSVC